MNHPLAEREIPYNTYLTTNMHSLASATEGIEIGSGTAPQQCNGGNIFSKEITRSYYDHELHYEPNIGNQELQQFSEEPSTLNICKFKNSDHIPTDDDIFNDTLPNEQCDNSLSQSPDMISCVQSGFDSNTLKRLLQSFPNTSQQEFLCPISKCLSTNWQMAFEQHTNPDQTQNLSIESYLRNNCLMLQQNIIDTKLQTVNQQRACYFS